MLELLVSPLRLARMPKMALPPFLVVIIYKAEEQIFVICSSRLSYS
ncbi:hypothetical protein [Caproicibacter sp.]